MISCIEIDLFLYRKKTPIPASPCPRASTTCPPCPALGEHEEHTERRLKGVCRVLKHPYSCEQAVEASVGGVVALGDCMSRH